MKGLCSYMQAVMREEKVGNLRVNSQSLERRLNTAEFGVQTRTVPPLLEGL